MQISNKVIYSLRVFLQLEQLGFKPISTTINPNNQKLICWIYEKTPEFTQALNEILRGD